MAIMANGIARGRVRRRFRRHHGRVAQHGGHTPSNGLTETGSLGLPCTFWD